jgi:hypothetical protein
MQGEGRISLNLLAQVSEYRCIGVSGRESWYGGMGVGGGVMKDVEEGKRGDGER